MKFKELKENYNEVSFAIYLEGPADEKFKALFGTSHNGTLNIPALGSISVEQAKDFAKEVLRAAEKASSLKPGSHDVIHIDL